MCLKPNGQLSEYGAGACAPSRNLTVPNLLCGALNRMTGLGMPESVRI